LEAPFRYPIASLEDIERLLGILAASPQLVPGSLRLAEGQELLVEQLKSERRVKHFMPLIKSGDFPNMVRALWEKPLRTQRPRFLRINAKLAADPNIELSLRIDVPTTGNLPRWVDLEGNRDPAVLAHLRMVYQEIARDAQLRLLEI
jgi:hypothetical protein